MGGRGQTKSRRRNVSIEKKKYKVCVCVCVHFIMENFKFILKLGRTVESPSDYHTISNMSNLRLLV